MQYGYTLNRVNQTKRLIENSSRPPVEIRQSNYQNINGAKHPTSVSMDFSSGVYLAIVKPALEKITVPWNIRVMNTAITCEEVSPRTDITGRKVCTKLVLYLTESCQGAKRNKIVLHFYHTSNSLQVQGSGLTTAGISTPVWLVDNFLQPLALKETTENQSSITEINTNIQQSVSFSCTSCKLTINPSATNPKDQELACTRCENMFHKKCTDRRRTTANWRRTPWYCSSCITGNQHDPAPQSTPSMQFSSNEDLIVTSENNVTVPDTHRPNMLGTPLSTQSSIAIISYEPPRYTTVTGAMSGACTATLTVSPTSTVSATTSAQSQTPSQASYTTTSPIVAALTLPSDQYERQSQTNPPVSRFPTTSTRQRSTNVSTSNAELEFQKTALSACRSTISQQETELKRLKETLDIRNKRIIQLESVVGHAADSVAARETTNPDNNYKILLDEINEIRKKVDAWQVSSAGAYPSNNIVINTCQPGQSRSRCDVCTQTDGLMEANPDPDHIVQVHQDGAEQVQDDDYAAPGASPLDSSTL